MTSPDRTEPAPDLWAEDAHELLERQTEVLEMMAEGLSTEQIAEKLFIGKVTVRTHVSNVLKKLRVPDRESAVRLVRSQTD